MSFVNQNPQKVSTKPAKWMRGLGGALLIIFLLPLINYLAYFISRGPLPPHPQVIAHRGGPACQPENTLSAFQYAIDQGVDWIEFDVQRTKDDMLIVFHDETVDRVTNGSGRVEDLTLAQIQSLDTGNGEVVPTFREVIALAKEANMRILPEIKSPHLYPGIAAQVVAALTENNYRENSVVQSFNYETLEEIQAVDGDIQLCPLYGLWDLDLSNPIPAKARILCPMAEMVILNPWMIRQAHAESREVYVWFGMIENRATVSLLINLGADGLMLDDPGLMVEIGPP